MAIDVGGRRCLRSTWVSSTELHCLTPPGTGRGHAVVVQLGTRTLRVPQAFHYRAVTLTGLRKEGEEAPIGPLDRPLLFAGETVVVLGENIGYAPSDWDVGSQTTEGVSFSSLLCSFTGKQGRGAVASSTRGSCTVPRGLHGSVSLRISNDGKRWSGGMDVDLEGARFTGQPAGQRLPLGFPAAEVPSRVTVAILVAANDVPAVPHVANQSLAWVRQTRQALVHTEVEHLVVLIDAVQAAAPFERAAVAWRVVMEVRAKAASPIAGCYLWHSSLAEAILAPDVAGAWTAPLHAEYPGGADIKRALRPGEEVPVMPVMMGAPGATGLSNQTLYPYFRRTTTTAMHRGFALALMVESAAAALSDQSQLVWNARDRPVVSAVVHPDDAWAFDLFLGFLAGAADVDLEVHAAWFGNGTARQRGEVAAVATGPSTHWATVGGLLDHLAALPTRTVFMYNSYTTPEIPAVLFEREVHAPDWTLLTSLDLVLLANTTQFQGTLVESPADMHVARAAAFEAATGLGTQVDLNAGDAFIGMYLAADAVLRAALPGSLPRGSRLLWANATAPAFDNLPHAEVALSYTQRGGNDPLDVGVDVLTVVPKDGAARLTKVGFYSVATGHISVDSSAALLARGPWEVAQPAWGSVALLCDVASLQDGLRAVAAAMGALHYAQSQVAVLRDGALPLATRIRVFCGSSANASRPLLGAAETGILPRIRSLRAAAGNEERMLAVVQSLSSSDTARLLALTRAASLVNIATSSTQASLNDLAAHPTLVRLTVSDNHQARAMLELLASARWPRFGVLGNGDSSYSAGLVGTLVELAERRGMRTVHTLLDAQSPGFEETVEATLAEWYGAQRLRVVVVIMSTGPAVRTVHTACSRLRLCGSNSTAGTADQPLTLLGSDALMADLWNEGPLAALAGGRASLRDSMQGLLGTSLGMGPSGVRDVALETMWRARMALAPACSHANGTTAMQNATTGVEAAAAALCEAAQALAPVWVNVVFDWGPVPAAEARASLEQRGGDALAAAARLLAACGMDAATIRSHVKRGALVTELRRQCVAALDAAPGEDQALVRPPSWKEGYVFDAVMLALSTARRAVEGGHSVRPDSPTFRRLLRDVSVEGASGSAVQIGEGSTDRRSAPFAYLNVDGSDLRERGQFFTANKGDFEECPAGTTRGSGSEGCEPCPVDSYSPVGGVDAACTDCPFVSGDLTRTTTGRVTGASHVTACACPVGYYLAPGKPYLSTPNGRVLAEERADAAGMGEVARGESLVMGCVRCGEGMVCKEPGLRLAEVGVAAGYWRGHPNATTAMPCTVPSRCPNASAVSLVPAESEEARWWRYSSGCAVGYAGPGCDACAAGFGRGFGATATAACVQCPVDSVLTVGAILQLAYFALLVAVVLSGLSSASRLAAQRKALNTRILLTFMQVNLLVLAFAPATTTSSDGGEDLDTDIPGLAVLVEVQRTVALAMLSWAVPLDCAFPTALTPAAQQLYAVALPAAAVLPLGVTIAMATSRGSTLSGPVQRLFRYVRGDTGGDEGAAGAGAGAGAHSDATTALMEGEEGEGQGSSKRRLSLRSLRLTGAAIAALFVLYPTVVEYGFQVMDCVDVPAAAPSGPYGCSGSVALSLETPRCREVVEEGGAWNSTPLTGGEPVVPELLATDVRTACVGRPYRILRTLGALTLTMLLVGAPALLVVALVMRSHQTSVWMEDWHAAQLSNPGLGKGRALAMVRAMWQQEQVKSTSTNVLFSGEHRDISAQKARMLRSMRVVVREDQLRVLQRRWGQWREAASVYAVLRGSAARSPSTSAKPAPAGTYAAAPTVAGAAAAPLDADEKVAPPPGATTVRNPMYRGATPLPSPVPSPVLRQPVVLGQAQAVRVPRTWWHGARPLRAKGVGRRRGQKARVTATPTAQLESRFWAAMPRRRAAQPGARHRTRASVWQRRLRSEAERARLASIMRHLYKPLLTKARGFETQALRNVRLLMVAHAYSVNKLLYTCADGSLSVDDAVALTLDHFAHCSHLHLQLGMLYTGFRDGPASAWELVFITRKALLLMVGVFLSGLFQLQAALALLLLCASMVVTLWAQPFIDTALEVPQLGKRRPRLRVHAGLNLLRARLCCHQRCHKAKVRVRKVRVGGVWRRKLRREKGPEDGGSAVQRSRRATVMWNLTTTTTSNAVMERWAHLSSERIKLHATAPRIILWLERHVLGSRPVRWLVQLPTRVSPTTMEVTGLCVNIFALCGAQARSTDLAGWGSSVRLAISGMLAVQVVLSTAFILIMAALIATDALQDKGVIEVVNPDVLQNGPKRLRLLARMMAHAGRSIDTVFARVTRDEVTAALDAGFILPDIRAEEVDHGAAVLAGARGASVPKPAQ